MATPPDLILKLRFDDQGFFAIGRKAHLTLVRNQTVILELNVEKLDPTALPPAFQPFDITGWTMRWIGKEDIDDADGSEKWDVAGSILDASAGRIAFTIPKANLDFDVQFGYSELVMIQSGDAQFRVPLTFTLSKPVLAI